MNREGANPWLINDHQMSEIGSDHGGIDDVEYGDMLIEINQMTLMSEGSKDDLMSEKGSDQSRTDDDGYGDMWTEMTLLLEGSKGAALESSAVEHTAVIEEQSDCDHSFVLNDDLGYVCHTCGLIDKRIETIFDFLWLKDNQTSIKGSDQSLTNDNGYGDMRRKMCQLTLMSECSKVGEQCLLSQSLKGGKSPLEVKGHPFGAVDANENGQFSSELNELKTQREKVRLLDQDAQRELHPKFHTVWGQLMKTGYQNSRLLISLAPRLLSGRQTLSFLLPLISPVKGNAEIKVLFSHETTYADREPTIQSFQPFTEVFIGSSQNGIKSLETRVLGLEMALDGISYDLAMSGRMPNTDSEENTCCKLPGAEFLSAKFRRKLEGRYSTSKFSSGGPLSSSMYNMDDIDCSDEAFKVENRIEGSGSREGMDLLSIH